MWVWWERSGPRTAKSAPDALKWVSFESHHQYGGARTNFRSYKMTFQNRGSPLYVDAEGGWPPIWSLHLRIDNTFHLIHIPMVPVQTWWCSNWIFVFINKNPVLTPPKPHWPHLYGYQSSSIINTEVQGLVLGHKKCHFKIGVPPYMLMLRVGDLQYSTCTSELIIQSIWYPY